MFQRHGSVIDAVLSASRAPAAVAVRSLSGVAEDVTATGQRLVKDVTERRRAEIARVVSAIPSEGRDRLVEALNALAEGAGEASDPAWADCWEL
ncbi:MAG: hypothetical protein ACRDY3_01705 [Acidimicrobiales bacterium]